ncbi:hypothetical protein WEI85_34720 [Actinomycetes bacterium KLBMP 9797]
MILLAEILGWTGAGVLLVAYALLSARRITAGAGYQLLNLAGSVGLAVNGVAHSAWPSTTLNLIWATTAALTLPSLLRPSPPPPPPPLPAAPPSPPHPAPRGAPRAAPTLPVDQGRRHMS